jgi:hypothetical protein
MAKFNDLSLLILALKTKIFYYIELLDIFHSTSKKDLAKDNAFFEAVIFF